MNSSFYPEIGPKKPSGPFWIQREELENRISDLCVFLLDTGAGHHGLVEKVHGLTCCRNTLLDVSIKFLSDLRTGIDRLR